MKEGQHEMCKKFLRLLLIIVYIVLLGHLSGIGWKLYCLTGDRVKSLLQTQPGCQHDTGKILEKVHNDWRQQTLSPKID